MKIKANQELFDRYNALSIRVKQLSNIIQNDYEVSDIKDLLDEFYGLYGRICMESSELANDTVKYLKGDVEK